jgi:Tfp pilus tip-associated adhesin PilY1
LARVVSTNAVNYATKSGWYLDFTTTLNTPAGDIASGERVIARPIQLGDTVSFATYTPGANECEGTGLGFLMFLNTFTGGQSSPVIDTNGDGVVNGLDAPATGGNYAGVKISGDGTLVSPIATLVGVQPPGVKGPPATGQTCGTEGKSPCPGPTPAKGCMAGLIDKNGTCVKPQCERGNISVQAGGTAQCVASADTKYPRWMELKWK